MTTKALERTQNRFALLGLIFFLAGAFFSKGFHHFDEHFQILEFARFKLFPMPTADLPWEFQAKMRSSLQPTLVVWVHSLLRAINIENPFWVTFILRCFTAILSWLTFRWMLSSFGREIPEKWMRLISLPLSFFFWLSIYNGVRFSSENWGGIFFAMGLCMAIRPNPGFLSGVLAGTLLGISFLSRFQMGIMLAGLVLWLLVVRKQRPLQSLSLALGFSSLLLIGILLDHGFYGGWPISFWNYFEQNLIHGKAAEFGVQPWYQYFKSLFIYLIPPFSVFFILGLFAFFWLYPRHVLSFALVPFLLVHMLLGHKEARFLFPIVYFFPVILGLSFAAASKRIRLATSTQWLWNLLLGSFWVVNGLLLAVVCSHPADKDTELYAEIFKANPDILLYTQDNPYLRAGLNLKYYQRPGLEVAASSDFSEQPGTNKKILVVGLESAGLVPREKVVYQSVPKWIRRYNFNHWLDRTRIWVLFWQ